MPASRPHLRSPQPLILGADVFVRPAETVARDLIGATLIRVIDRASPPERFIVTETEAYIGPHDLACHAAKGRTKRTDVMFGQPGLLYVYFVYGLHWMLNVVTREEGYPSAVLIRGVQGVNGPGRVTRRLRIDGSMHGQRADTATGLWFEARGAAIPKRAIIATPRIGINYAGPVWRDRKLRFLLSTDHSAG